MDQALGWIGAIIQWFGQFFPRWHVVDTRYAWIKWIKGKRVVTGGPGIVWWWPATTKLIVWAVARQSFDLRAQTLTTKDDVAVMVGGLITYEIADIEKAVGQIWDTDETIRDSALTALHEVVTSHTYAELKDSDTSRRLKSELRAEAVKVLGPMGVRVIKLSLTDLAKTRVLKIALSTDSTGDSKIATELE